MQIDLRTLEQGESRIEADIAGDSVGLRREDLALQGPLHVALILDRRGDEIWIRGKVEAVTPQQCSRCLSDYLERLELEFEVFCAKVRPHSTIDPTRLDAEEGGIHFHDGRVLTVDEEIREAVILGLPMRPLCKESCLGLCPHCGEDRNQGPCRCERGL
jgi:uncharacterized protein